MAAYQLLPPDPMNCNGDVATNWKVFRDAYADYVIAELSQKEPEVQAATLKTNMGKECKQILNRLGLTAEELKKTDTILTKLEAHFAPVRNILFERYRFHSAEQQPTETVDQFLIRLKHLAESCAFSNLQDDMVRDRLVLGCQDHEARARLFREKECTLAKAVEVLRVSEATRQQLKHINDEVTDGQSINAVKVQHSSTATSDQSQSNATSRQRASTTKAKPCTYCGQKHERNNCPAFGKQCHQCGKLNHFKSVCRQQNKGDNQPVAQMEEEKSEDSDNSIFVVECIGTVTHNNLGQYFVHITVITDSGSNVIVDCQLDTGATCNIMTYADLCAIQQTGRPSMQSSTSKLKFYDNSTLRVLGERTLHCQYKCTSHSLNFKIIRGTQKPLLSGTTCEKLGLITVNAVNALAEQGDCIIAQFSDVFQGLGCLAGDYNIDIDPSVKPVQHVP